MTKSQNTKNEQQKNLCITSEQLTAQWKKGELPADKDYYIKLKSGLILIDYYCQLYDNCHFPIDIGFDSIPEDDIVEILAPVPSYEEWQASYNCMLENEVLRLKNAQLKELLKECIPYFDALVEKRLKLEYIPQVYELLTKINEVLK